MGRKKQNKSAADLLDVSDSDSTTSNSTALSDVAVSHETENINTLDAVIERCLDSLDKKSSRLKALSELVNTFQGNMVLPFIENKCITLLDEYLISLKKGKGSPTEACLASRAIGLLSITIGSGSSGKEIMEECLPHLERALSCGSDAFKLSILDCLAITTFVGANNWEETEKSMKVMWEIIQSKSASKVNKPSAAVLAAAVSAWSFLLTTMGGWRIDLNSWIEPITLLHSLLENDDRSVRLTAGEALAIVFEIVVGDKLSSEMAAGLDDADPDNPKPKWFKQLLSLEAKIINQVTYLSMEAGGKGTGDKKNLNNQRDLFQKIYRYFQDQECPESSTKIPGHGLLVTSTWAQLIQLNFLKRFLATGFLKHAQENELLLDTFALTPDRKDNLSSKEKRVNRSSEGKGRTQERNKYRQMAQQRKVGHIFSYDDN